MIDFSHLFFRLHDMIVLPPYADDFCGRGSTDNRLVFHRFDYLEESANHAQLESRGGGRISGICFLTDSLII